MNLELLKKLAKAATPGPWKNDIGNYEIESRHEDFFRKVICNWPFYENSYCIDLNSENFANMDYIEALSPEVVLQMIELIEKLQAK
jgi:hypothetical protein